MASGRTAELPPPRRATTLRPMSAIAQHLAHQARAELARRGIAVTGVAVLSAEADDWRYRIDAEARAFELGFSRRDGAWARETTPGREKHLISNDHARVHDPARAEVYALSLVANALRNPAFPPRDPPVI